MNVNLHELINQPGAGKHMTKLQENGLWDEWAGMPMKNWNVEVEGVITDISLYEVKARCEEEAMCLAEKLAEKDYDEYEIMEAFECN